VHHFVHHGAVVIGAVPEPRGGEVTFRTGGVCHAVHLAVDLRELRRRCEAFRVQISRDERVIRLADRFCAARKSRQVRRAGRIERDLRRVLLQFGRGRRQFLRAQFRRVGFGPARRVGPFRQQHHTGRGKCAVFLLGTEHSDARVDLQVSPRRLALG